MTVETQLNNFSIISRLFGNLFYRQPTDPIMANVFAWLQQKGLEQVWCLETDQDSKDALEAVQMPVDLKALEKEYQRLFTGDNALVSARISDYGIKPEHFLMFRQERGMTEIESADHFGLVFLTASWIEDNLNSVQAQKELFETFLLPCASKFFNQVEKQANLPFYRALALLSREILSAMADELEESEE
ncbi:molecular chaperone [Haemophilus haemoglobinophilus]|nr:molecular chaperone [Canicola haemoglobinophilus]